MSRRRSLRRIIKEEAMKKLLAIVLAALMLLTACAKDGADMGEPKKESKKFKIGIVQLVEHPALDNARMGFEDQLKALGIEADIDYQSAQGDIPTARTIAEKFVNDKVDLIYAIATPAAQAAAGATTEIPVLFSAVTDAVAAELVASNEMPGGNVTGTSDAADLDSQLDLFKKIDPNINTIGMIYTADEVNSVTQVKQVEEMAPKFGLKTVSKSITQISDLPQVAQSIMAEADAFYVLTDNKIASSISILADILKENKKISVSAEESHIDGGLLISKSLSYQQLGKQTADMAKKILVDGAAPKDIPVETAKELKLSVNTKTLEVLGLDKGMEVFKGAIEIDK